MNPLKQSRMRSTAGFTLVELTVVVVISTIALIAVYQTLITQERTYRYQSGAIDAQGTSRMALQVVAGELREISASAGLTAGMGGTDLLMATNDSIGFRALRKVGIVCSLIDQANGSVDVWVPGDAFVAGDQILLYQANDPETVDDDAWFDVAISNVRAARDPGCALNWGDYTVQNLTGIGPAVVATLARGSLVRSYETATYGTYAHDDYWVVGRSLDGAFEPLVGPVLPPEEGGLEFRYFDDSDNELTPTTDAQRSSVARVAITVRAVSRRAGMNNENWVDSVSTNVFLRGN